MISMIDYQWETATEGIRSPIKLRNGQYGGEQGVYWAWEVDGYFDIHFTAPNVLPDGSDVVWECCATVGEARKEAREMDEWERKGF